jgi:hydroxymethylpyrimidine pyrophosphatase-like HAD family hydrolase
MTKKGILFTDVDGTLVFHRDFHRIRQLKDYQQGKYLVLDPDTGTTHSALDVSVPPLVVYLAESTRQLAYQLKESYRIILATGATEQSMKLRLRNLDFADGYILEHGGRILDKDFQEDLYWAARFAPYFKELGLIKKRLEASGWQIVDAGRKTFLQVKVFENPHRSNEEFQQLCRTLELPEGFRMTFNLGNLTVMPESAGKGKAVSHFLAQQADPSLRSIGIGDDLNDINFLQVCQKAYVLGSALPEVKQIANQRGWFVSAQPHFSGVDEILTEIITSE